MTLPDPKTLKSMTPLAALMFIVFFLLGVFTGIVPTPLMQGLEAATETSKEHNEMTPILEDIRYYQKTDCLRKATNADERAECVPKLR